MTLIDMQDIRDERVGRELRLERKEGREELTRSTTKNVELVAATILKLCGRTAFITFLTNVMVACCWLLVKEGGHEARDAAIGIAIDHTD